VTLGSRLHGTVGALAPRSLAFRVVAFSTIWAVVALVVISTVIVALYRQSSERGFQSLLSAHLFNLIGSVGISDDGRLTGAPDLGDLRFSRPGSGWYWAVEPVGGDGTGTLSSLSMTEPVPPLPIAQVPFDASFQRVYRTTGPRGEQLEVIESEFVLDAQNRAARFRVMGNRTELEAEISDFEWRLYGFLAAFGLGMVAINAVVILFGLRPLRRVSEALSQVREGTAQRLGGRFPAEIEPLANETNALIENNRRIVERSRTQVGNLAHSLKTPLAVMLNEARALGGDQGRLMEGQAAAMQQQLEHYLQRARVAAQRHSVVYRTPVRPVLERMVRVMAKIGHGLSVTLGPTPEDLLFAGEREDLEEMVGNVMDNAVKWGRSAVRVSARTVSRPGEQPGLEIVIEDDGPGIPADKAREALKRGRRLDESKPGTGLGLAIVADLVAEYDGAISLEAAERGGLRVVLRLPAVA
jgi:signal transduction histidine kinase